MIQKERQWFYTNGCSQLVSTDISFFSPHLYKTFIVVDKGRVHGEHSSCPAVLWIMDPSVSVFVVAQLVRDKQISHIIGGRKEHVRWEKPAMMTEEVEFVFSSSRLRSVAHCRCDLPFYRKLRGTTTTSPLSLCSLICIDMIFSKCFRWVEEEEEQKEKDSNVAIPISTQGIFIGCQFLESYQLSHISNVCFDHCQISSFPFSSTVGKYDHGRSFVACGEGGAAISSRRLSSTYLRNQRYASCSPDLRCLNFENPRIMLIPEEKRGGQRWVLELVQNIPQKKIHEWTIGDCISPNRSSLECPLNLEDYLGHYSCSLRKSFLLLPHGYYRLSTPVHLRCHLIGVGKPIIRFTKKAKIYVSREATLMSHMEWIMEEDENADLPRIEVLSPYCMLSFITIRVLSLSTKGKDEDYNHHRHRRSAKKDPSCFPILHLSGDECQIHCMDIVMHRHESNLIVRSQSNRSSSSSPPPPPLPSSSLSSKSSMIAVKGNDCFIHSLFFDRPSISCVSWEGKNGTFFFMNAILDPDFLRPIVQSLHHPVSFISCGIYLPQSTTVLPLSSSSSNHNAITTPTTDHYPLARNHEQKITPSQKYLDCPSSSFIQQCFSLYFPTKIDNYEEECIPLANSNSHDICHTVLYFPYFFSSLSAGPSYSKERRKISSSSSFLNPCKTSFSATNTDTNAPFPPSSEKERYREEEKEILSLFNTSTSFYNHVVQYDPQSLTYYWIHSNSKFYQKEKNI